MKVKKAKQAWNTLIKKHYGVTFPKLYRVKFNKSGIIKDRNYTYAMKHFSSICLKFEEITGVNIT